MDVHLSPELQTKLTHLAAEQGRAAEALVQEAVERLVEYDEWFSQEVAKGLAAARGELVEHDEIARRIASRYPG
jgi:predicted transcriptional regulator